MRRVERNSSLFRSTLLQGNFRSSAGFVWTQQPQTLVTPADARDSLPSERLGTALTSVATDRELIEAVVGEMHDGIERALDFWMAQIEDALRDPRLTTLGRMNAVKEIVNRYATARSGGSHGYAA